MHDGLCRWPQWLPIDSWSGTHKAPNVVPKHPRPALIVPSSLPRDNLFDEYQRSHIGHAHDAAAPQPLFYTSRLIWLGEIRARNFIAPHGSVYIPHTQKQTVPTNSNINTYFGKNNKCVYTFTILTIIRYIKCIS